MTVGDGYQTVVKPYTGGAPFRVEETVTVFEGREYVRHVVRHSGGVGVVALLGSNVVCVEQYRPAVERVTLEIPAGRPELGETVQQAGRRELLEETGLEPIWLAPLTRFYNAPCFCDGASEVLIASVRPAERERPLNDDLPLRVRLIDLAEIEDLMLSETLLDATSIIALLMARAWLAKEGRLAL